ncbi:hypothetical protein [Methanofollis ethanolicus]|nr:hypothetical protein [Methanofollis ethanolicus]
MVDFSGCLECESILNGEGGIKCMLYRYRKYLIGILVGAVVCYVLMRRGR